MTAVALTSPVGGNLHAPLPEYLDDAGAHWARAALIASAIPGDADLDDLDDVIRALFCRAFSWDDIEDVLDDAIEMAKGKRI